MEPLYYTNAHNGYFKPISKRLKLQKEKEKKNRSLITSFSLPAAMAMNMNEGYSYKQSYKKGSLFRSPKITSNSGDNYGLQPLLPSASALVSINGGSHSKVHATIILIANQNYQAKSKGQMSVNAKEHLKLVSRKGNGFVLVKPIGRLANPGIVPTSVVNIVDVGNSDKRRRYDMNWLNSSDNVGSYENSTMEFTAPSRLSAAYNEQNISTLSDHSSPKSHHERAGSATLSRSGSLSISKAKPVHYIPIPSSSTPDTKYSYESKGQYSKESTETINSFEKELKRSNSVSTIDSTVSSIHSLSFKKPLPNTSSPDLDDSLGLKNDINYIMEENDLEEVDDYLTGFDQEHAYKNLYRGDNSNTENYLLGIEDVCVSNVYNNNGRYWYKVEIFYKNGNKKFLRRYYQDFYDLHINVLNFINSYYDYFDSGAVPFPKIPGPIPRPDPSNPSKALLQRCHDLNIYFKELFVKLSHDGYKNDVFEEWIYPRFGDYNINDEDSAAASLGNSIIFERPIITTEEINGSSVLYNDIKTDEVGYDNSIASARENKIEGAGKLIDSGLGPPKPCVSKNENPAFGGVSFDLKNSTNFGCTGSNNKSSSSTYLQGLDNKNLTITSKSRVPRSPLTIQVSPNIRQQVINKNLPPIPTGDPLPPLTPMSSKRYQFHNGAHPTPISTQTSCKFFPFNRAEDDDDEEENVPADKSNNDIMQEIESELNMQNVSIVNLQDSNACRSGEGRPQRPKEANNGVPYSEHQISGPQIRVKVFYNDGEDIFITKVPVSVNLCQLKHKIFARIKSDFAKRECILNIADIFLFSKDSNGMYSAIKDDIGLRGVIRTAKGKFSVRIEFD